MSNYITVDSGTTNTRISLVRDLKVIDTLKFNVGAKNGIDNKTLLRNTIRTGIKQMLTKNNISENNITRILASGMITSEFGLCPLEHIVVPVGISELHNSMEEVVLNDISEIPFVFIRGVKTKADDMETADIMRGEETEIMGVMTSEDCECVYILPGSHSKIIQTDKSQRITGFLTMLTGELASAVAQNTILKSSVKFEFSEIDREYIIKGYEYCLKNGINSALFKVRILSNIFSCDNNRIYSFFMGVILCGEINFILKNNPEKVVIGGKKEIREAMVVLLREYFKNDIVCLSDEIVDTSVSLGMVKIYEYIK